MSGIYVHIPYCKVKCHYCDFHFSTNHSTSDDMLNAILKEIDNRKSFLEDQLVSTIYFGGGTPSAVPTFQIEQILTTIHQNFNVSNDCEITLECNPDDLSEEKLRELKSVGVNRLSIGIQSFDGEVLQSMNRAHTAKQAFDCIGLTKKVGFENITIDLIYGIPDRDMNYWENQLKLFLQADVPHLSAYCLTIEPNTVFNHLHSKGDLNMPSDELSLRQFELMIDMLEGEKFQHYEISNFAKDGFISRHNSAYWLGKHYIGIGPSAHSYNGKERGWNISNNHNYIRDPLSYEKEELTERDRINDHILTRLRTHWGIDLEELSTIAETVSLKEMIQQVKFHAERGNVFQDDQGLKLTKQGKFIADKIAADLFV